MLSPDRFQELFPAFSDFDEVERAIAVVGAISNGYAGIEDGATREIAQALHVAHHLTLSERERSGTAGPVKSEKSRNDAITYAVADTVLGDLQSTSYGSQLRSLLDTVPF